MNAMIHLKLSVFVKFRKCKLQLKQALRLFSVYVTLIY